MDEISFLDGAPQDTICEKQHRGFGAGWDDWRRWGSSHVGKIFQGKSRCLTPSPLPGHPHATTISAMYDISQENVIDEEF